jgi:hypothetical protein
VSTRDISTSTPAVACDVCGRTLLRGERAEVYIAGGDRRSVCELCTSRALHEGWVREGTVPAFDDPTTGTERRRSLLSRWRSRRESTNGDPIQPGLEKPIEVEPDPESPRRVREPDPEPPRRVREPIPQPVREPRHVRAVPTSVEQKVASAIDLFNGSEHCKTVAGVARSLGAPTVSVRPSGERASLVNVVVSWELCWYRYEVDLSDDQPSVRVGGQGYELDELPTEDREPNAVADDHGRLAA